MTDFSKYRNISLDHDTYKKLERLSKTVAPIPISMSKTLLVLINLIKKRGKIKRATITGAITQIVIKFKRNQGYEELATIKYCELLRLKQIDMASINLIFGITSVIKIV